MRLTCLFQFQASASEGLAHFLSPFLPLGFLLPASPREQAEAKPLVAEPAEHKAGTAPVSTREHGCPREPSPEQRTTRPPVHPAEPPRDQRHSRGFLGNCEPQQMITVLSPWALGGSGRSVTMALDRDTGSKASQPRCRRQAALPLSYFFPALPGPGREFIVGTLALNLLAPFFQTQARAFSQVSTSRHPQLLAASESERDLLLCSRNRG